MIALTPRQRRVLVRLLWLAVVAVALMQGLRGPGPGAADPLPLELADSARRFRQIVLADWMQPAQAPGLMPRCGFGAGAGADLSKPGLPSFGRLRCNLFVDSVLLVPAYVALLVALMLALGPPLARHPWRRQLLCVPAVAAGLFDVAENSMTGRALDDLLLFALHDQTVADITLASRIKWLLLALTLGLLAWRCRAALTADRGWAAAAAVLLAAAALALAAGGAMLAPDPLRAGLGLLAGAIALLAWRLLRRPPPA